MYGGKTLVIARFRALCLILIFFQAASAHAQTTELRRMSIEHIPPPDQGIPVFRDHPDKAALIIHSSLTNLTFDSNMGGIVDQRSEPASGRYILIIEPFTQIMQINAPGFMTGRFRVAAPRARDVLYYEIEPEERTPDLIPLVFNVDPDDARLFVDDQITETNRTVQLPPGPKQIRLEREGFRVLEDVITVSMDNVLFNYRMEEIEIVPVHIQSNVPGARVHIDGMERGQIDNTGGMGLFLYPGSYVLTLSHSGYATENKTLQVSEDADNRASVTLTRSTGTLSLQVTPPDAKVQLNREDYTGQAQIELAPGRYRLEIEKPGYEPYSQMIDISLNEQTSKSIHLDAHTGSLQFSVVPSSARSVLRDDTGQVVRQWEGFTLIHGLKAGRYDLSVEADGHSPWSGNITVEKDDVASITVDLVESMHGSLRVTANIPDAMGSLYTNGTPVAQWQGDRTFTNLSPGNYKISYRSSSHRDYDQTITLSAGEAKAVSARLVKFHSMRSWYLGMAYHQDAFWGPVWGGFLDYMMIRDSDAFMVSMDVRISEEQDKPEVRAFDAINWHVNFRFGYAPNIQRSIAFVPCMIVGFNWISGDLAVNESDLDPGINFGVGVNVHYHRLMARFEYIWYTPPVDNEWNYLYDYGEEQFYVSLSFGVGF